MATSFDIAADRERWCAALNDFRFPDVESLIDGLNRGLRKVDVRGIEAIIARRRNRHTSTYPSEIVTCLSSDGSRLDLILKYGPLSCTTGYGHRGGVSYEAQIYSEVLTRIALGTPRYYGSFLDEEGRMICLMTKYVEDCQRINKVPNPQERLRHAARWLGHFHRRSAANDCASWFNEFTTYDVKYYHGWASRASTYWAEMGMEQPWFLPLCEVAGQYLNSTLGESPAIIHGEYCPENILVHLDNIIPVDWESCAVASAEIDLAMLTDLWPQEEFYECVSAYLDARSLEDLPKGFERRLCAAQLYVNFRWIGDHRWSRRAARSLDLAQEGLDRRFATMFDLAQRLALIS